MIDAKYELINDKKVIVEKINSLEKMAREVEEGGASLFLSTDKTEKYCLQKLGEKV